MRSTNRKAGLSVLVVLAFLAMTIGLSYAMVRSQFTGTLIQQNYSRNLDARQAAYTGLSLALRKMHQSDWAGVNTPLSFNLGNGQSATVSFQTGDATLTPSSPAYAEYPFRVTLTSQGSAVDPRTSSVASTATVRAVVRLVPRKLFDPPGTWDSVQGHTLYQWGSSSGNAVSLDFPARVEGSVYARGEIKLGANYPGDGDDVPFAGQIDDVAIFAKALSDQQMRDLANRVISLDTLANNGANLLQARWRLDEPAGSLIADDDKNANDGLFDGAKSGGAPANGTHSATFDGFDDQIYLGDVRVTGQEITLIAWIRPTAWPSSHCRILSKTTGLNEQDHQWMLSTHDTGNGHRLRFRVRTKQNGTATLIASTGNLPVGNWTLAAAVFDGFTMKLFKDGTLVGSRSHSRTLSDTTGIPTAIGNNPPGSPRALWLRDLTRLWKLQGTDYRPLTGPIIGSSSTTSARTRSLIEDELQATWSDTASSNTAPASHPGQVGSYQLYPGGKQYQATALGFLLENTTLGPNTDTNPLGLFYRFGPMLIDNNVKLTGTLVLNGSSSFSDCFVHGQNVVLQSVNLPALAGSTQAIQLPVAIFKDDVFVSDECTGSTAGLIYAADRFEFSSGKQSSAFGVTGKVVAKQFTAAPRDEWDQSDDWWRTRATDYLANLTSPVPILFFPNWLKSKHGLDPEPRLYVRPDSTNPYYHWPTWGQPVFIAHPADGGLRWELLDLREIQL